MSIIGITGTRQGLTPQQRPRFASYLRHPSVEAVHHGDCVGVDAEAHVIATEANRRVIVHPPIELTLRAFCRVQVDDDRLPPKPFIERNHDIVDACSILIACPHEAIERPRGSGTWATIRYARKIGRELIIIYPDGTLVRENGT